MEITIRPETEQDYKTVETVTREAFWNVHFPGAEEHLLIHHLRNAAEFVHAFDFVAIYNSEIVGNIVYAESKIIYSNTEYIVLTFGPLSVLPKYQNMGIGTKLIMHTKTLAAELGYRAILIYGDPIYYKRFGFRASKEFRITNREGKYPAVLLALELYPGALNGIQGQFDEGNIYAVDPKELEEFEKGFAKKEKQVTHSQERFNELANTYL